MSGARWRGVLVLLGSTACFYQPSGSHDGGAESTAGTTEPTTSGTTGDCDDDGECDPGEDAQRCPADCDGAAACGDGAIGGVEVCDDGANNGMYGYCEADCSGEIGCGDDVRNGDEFCDDGPFNSDGYTPAPHCNAACSGAGPACGDAVCQSEFEDANGCPADCSPVCGNGIPEPGEACDDGDGTPLDSAECDADCTIAECGDEYVSTAADETCDDGNADDSDDCPSSCKSAFCGDGFVQAGFEVCDDGDAVNDNDCSNACERPRVVFVSKQTRTGALLGLEGANLLCNTWAGAAGLLGGNNFRAWLSDSVTGPADFFDTAFTGAYKLVDGSVVASDGWTGLTTQELVHPIDLNEDGNPVNNTVWTNTLPDGTPAGADDCSGWTLASGTGAVGDSSEKNDDWTDLGGGQFCNSGRNLYCFEDLP